MTRKRNDLLRKAMKASADAHYAVMFANFKLKGKGYGDADYVDRVDVIDAAILLLSQAKWLFWRSTGEAADFARRTGSDEDLREAIALFGRVCEFAGVARDEQGLALMQAATDARLIKTRAAPGDGEILTFGGAPIVPSVCPIVVLSGSSEAMGRQYVSQISDIFGRTAFAGVEGRVFSEEERTVLAKWETPLAEHAPEILELARGMAQGAAAAGLELGYEHFLYLWTGVRPPVEKPTMIGVLDAEICSITGYFGSGDDEDMSEIEDAPDLCSGFAAWGDATAGEGAVVGCTTDHDCTFQATIIAYPDEGHPFIYTPFSVNGSIPGVGRYFFAGHPGVNAKGLAYVHHGGPCGCSEPQETWGYGVRRGATTFHNLRYADDLKDAEDYELSLPVGDNGYLLGSPGGFYADPAGGYVIESRLGAAGDGASIIRRSTPDADDDEHDFLYANNNMQSPQSGELFCSPEGGYDYTLDGGWHVSDKGRIFASDLGVTTRRMWAASSEPRNRYLHRVLSEGAGRIDPAYAEAIYRRPAHLDTTDWPHTEERLSAGEKLDSSTGTRLNAFTAIIELSNDKPPAYKAAIGPIAHRSVSPHRAGYGFYYYDEANEMWNVSLEASLTLLLQHARGSAQDLIKEAQSALAAADIKGPGLARLEEFAREAEALIEQSEAQGADAEHHNLADEQLASLSRELRRITRAQVRARQIISAVIPPVSDPGLL